MKLDSLYPSFKLIDQSYNGDYSGNYHLSFILSPKGFAYCILDLKLNRLNALEEVFFQDELDPESLSKQLRSEVTKSQILSRPFKSISVGLYSEKSTMLPAGLYEKSKMREYLQFNFSDELLSASSDYLPDNDLYNIYHIPDLLTKTIKELFTGAKVFHFASPVIESLLMENKHKAQRKVYLHILQKNKPGTNRFEIIIFYSGKLLFYNSFLFQEKEDIAYFTLYVLEQLNISPENLPVTILGNILKTDEALNLLRNYVIVEFGNRPGNFEYSSVFDEVPSHFYYALLSQYLHV